MSRQINLEEQLSDEDRGWLLRNNGQLAVVKNDQKFGREPEEGEYGELSRHTVQLMTGDEPSRTSDRFTPTGLTPDNPADVEKAARDAQFRAALEAESEEDDAVTAGHFNRENTDGVGPYDTWSKEDLQGECERRELSRSGNKPELVERLRAHDEEAEEFEPED